MTERIGAGESLFKLSPFTSQSEAECAAAVKGILLSYDVGVIVSDPSHHEMIEALLDQHPRCV